MINKRITIGIGSIAIILLVGGIIFWRWQGAKEPPEKTIGEADRIVQQTIDGFKEDAPETFTDMQKIVDLGNKGIEPLMDRADSAAIKNQWASVVGLNTIARSLNKKDCILNQMKALALSPFLTIRMYAAASLAENGDFSKKQILLDGLTSKETMMFMRPPKSVSEFANLTLEITTGQTMEFTQASTDADKSKAIAKWEEYLKKMP